MKEIHKFFAVTTTSAYLVTDSRDEKGFPIVQKIFKKLKSGVEVGSRLKGGRLVGIMNIGIILYDEDHPRSGRTQPPEMVNTYFWGAKTSPLVALFLNKNKAIECINSDKPRVNDPRWKEETKKVLESIANHPTFIVSASEHPLDPIRK